MAELVIVHHPTIAGVSYEVPKGDVDRWVDQGWKKTEPKALKDQREGSE